MNAVDFEWPKALRAVKAAAEDGSIEPRNPGTRLPTNGREKSAS